MLPLKLTNILLNDFACLAKMYLQALSLEASLLASSTCWGFELHLPEPCAAEATLLPFRILKDG